jgi:Ca2+-binding RTX toxin-like protein
VDLGTGNDRLQLTGAFDESWVRAGFGSDVVLLGGGGDLTGRLSGGDGIDRLGFEARTQGVDVRLERDWVLDLPSRAKDGFELDADDWEEALEDVLTIDSFEIVVGSAKADVLSAKASDLLLQGGAGDDWLLIDMGASKDPFGTNSLLVHGGVGRDTYLFHGWDQPGYSWASSPVQLDMSVLELREGKERLATANGRGDVSLLSVATNRGDAPLGTTLLPIDTIENLLAGIAEPDHNRLAIASSLGEGGMLVMLGDQMPSRYAPVATFRFDQEDLVVWNR